MKSRISTVAPPLQCMPWPLVNRFDQAALDELLHDLKDPTSEGIHTRLAALYPYSFGYQDSPLFQVGDGPMESRLTALRISLEDQLLNTTPLSTALASCESSNHSLLVACLRTMVSCNKGVSHRFFDYCANDAGISELTSVAKNEVCRNEVVDDEVAMMLPGLSGLVKNTVALNLADEMGHGKLQNQHTYWLKQQLADNDEIAAFSAYRKTRAWYMHIPSNVFNALLLRPGYRWAAFGHFLVTESWVAPHFEKLIHGFQRVGYTRQLKYFTAHETLDRLHGDELLDALEYQTPELTVREVQLVEWGARLAIEAGVQYFDLFLANLKGRQE